MQGVQHQRPCLSDGLFHRQHPDDVIADAEMMPFGFDVGVDDLMSRELCGLRLPATRHRHSSAGGGKT